MSQDLWDAPEKCGDASEIRTLLWMAENIASEPLKSGWHPPDLAALMQTHSFAVERDVSLPELNRDYFVPAGRPVPEEQQWAIERMAIAIKK